MNYNEEQVKSRIYKENYVSDIENLIAKRHKAAEAIRKEYAKDIFSNQEKYRSDFKAMLGWPLVDCKAEGIPTATSELLSEEDGYDIYRMQFEVMEDLHITGLFFKEKSTEKKPLVIVQHGGLGTPELISGFYGSTSNYNDMLHRVRQKGVHVFAPQLILWADKYEVDFNRDNIDARLKSVGSSIAALEIYSIMRILDYFEAKDYVSTLGMVGLSYGGFFTLYTAAIDTRIKSAISCSFFCNRDQKPERDWLWTNAAYKFNDAEVASLVYPRSIYIAMGNEDQLFDHKYSIESFERLKEMCQDVGTDWINFEVFDGNHEFIKHDEPIQKLADDLMQ